MSPNSNHPPHPCIPFAWFWRCHSCGTSYSLGTTRRCLECGHIFCSAIENVNKSKKRRRGKVKVSNVCYSEFDYAGWKNWGNWRRKILLDPVMATPNKPRSCFNTSEAQTSTRSASGDDQKSAARLVRQEIVQGLQANTKRRIFLKSGGPSSPLWQKQASQTAEEQRHELFLKREHNCWIHCDSPSECRYTLYKALVTGEVPESVLYVRNRCTSTEATVTGKGEEEAISGAGQDPKKEISAEQAQMQASSVEVDGEVSDNSDESDVDMETSAAEPTREKDIRPDQETPVEETSPRPVSSNELLAMPVHTFDEMDIDGICDAGLPRCHVSRSSYGCHHRSLQPKILQLSSGPSTGPGGSLNPTKLSPSSAEEEPSWHSSSSAPWDPDLDVNDALKATEESNAERGGDMLSASRPRGPLHGDVRARHASYSSWSKADGQNKDDGDQHRELAEGTGNISRDGKSKIDVSKNMGLDSLEQLASGTGRKRTLEESFDGGRPVIDTVSSPKAWLQRDFGFRTPQKLALQTSSHTTSTIDAAGTSFLLPASPQSPDSLAPHDDQKKEKDGDGEEKAHPIPSDVPQHQQDARRGQQNIEGKECPSSSAVETEVSFAEAAALDLLLDGLVREDEMVMPLGYGDGVGWQTAGEGNGKNRRITYQAAAPKADKSRGEEGCGGNNTAAKAKKGGGGGDSDDEEQGGILGRLFLTERKGRRKGSSIDTTSKVSPPTPSATAAQNHAATLSHHVDQDIQDMIRLNQGHQSPIPQ